MSPLPQVDVLLFDFGGVLMRLHDPAETFGLSSAQDEFSRQWLMSPAVRAHEQGRIDAATFAEQIVAEANLPYDAGEFLERFAAWPDRLFDGIPELLDELPARFRRGLLSNTNAVHWESGGTAEILEPRFDRVFLSYRTGLIKPDAASFLDVARRFDCAPERIWFFDDNPLNVAGARAVGMQASVTNGPDDIRKVIDHLQSAG